MELWFTEIQKPGLGITCKVRQTLYREKTPFQEIAVLDTYQFGRMLVLDGTVQLTILDEFVYHEMLAHVPLLTHPAPNNVLIIGGGDGGTAREVLRHSRLCDTTLVEIDRRVVEVSRQLLPELACSYDNPRLQVHFEDGVAYLAKKDAGYDVVLVDAPDPVGQAARLFGADFYESIFKALRPDGLFAAHIETPFFDSELITHVYRDVSRIFPIVRVYMAVVPTYPGALWCFITGSKKYDPEAKPREAEFSDLLRYYNAELHQAAFKLPSFVNKILHQEV